MAPMQLRQYLKKNNLSQEEFARLTGFTQPMVWQWLHGKRPVSAQAAIKIDEATNGEVSREELRPDIFDRARKRRAA